MEKEVQYAYCSACDQQVPVVLKDDTVLGPTPSAHDPSNLVCLAYGDTCTGSMCPLFDVPTEKMKENFEKSDLKPGDGQAPSRD